MREVPLEAEPQNYARVMVLARQLLAIGAIDVWPHAVRAMADDGLEMTDLVQLIKTGRVRPNSHSKPADRWRWVIEGETVDNGPAACVVQIDDDLGVVTVYALRRRR